MQRDYIFFIGVVAYIAVMLVCGVSGDALHSAILAAIAKWMMLGLLTVVALLGGVAVTLVVGAVVYSLANRVVSGMLRVMEALK